MWREDDYTVDAAAVVARAETRSDLREALSHLPTIYRTVVVLHDAEGMTMREIAEIQQVTLAAAKQRLRRARMMLVSQLATGHERRQTLRGVPLRCWEARRHISDYLDGELEPAVARTVEKHLETCPTCPPLYAALVGTTNSLGTSTARDSDTVVPADLADRLLSPPSAAGER
jgi:RNA polymerase sigma-70 factor, ECF subfamily